MHFYTFSQGTDSDAAAERELRQGVEAAGFNISKIWEIQRVREVAPFTWQIAIDAEVKSNQF